MKILIVDNKKENLYLLEHIIKKIGYEVVMAENGKQALDGSFKKKSKSMIRMVMKNE